MAYGMLGEGVKMNCGLRQGSPEAALIFSAIISQKLTKLASSWKARGLGFRLGAVGGDTGTTDRWKKSLLVTFRGMT
jgi:hypothetical protein